MEKVFSSFYFLGYTEVGTVGEKNGTAAKKNNPENAISTCTVSQFLIILCFSNCLFFAD